MPPLLLLDDDAAECLFFVLDLDVDLFLVNGGGSLDSFVLDFDLLRLSGFSFVEDDSVLSCFDLDENELVLFENDGVLEKDSALLSE